MRSTNLYHTARIAGYTIQRFTFQSVCTADESAMLLSYKSSRYTVRRCYRAVKDSGEGMPFVFWMPSYSRSKVVLSIGGKVRAFTLDKKRGELTWTDLKRMFTEHMQDLQQRA